MRLTYDPKHNIAYIGLRKKSATSPQVETIRVSDEMNIDIAPDGTVYGIELLNANEQLTLTPAGTLSIINESNGSSTQLRMTA